MSTLCINLEYPGGGPSGSVGSKNWDAAYRSFELERQFIEKLVDNVGEGHDVLYSMDVTGWTAKFISNILISEFADGCPGVLRVCPLE